MLRSRGSSWRTQRYVAARGALAFGVLALGACSNGSPATPTAGDDGIAAAGGKGPMTGSAGATFELKVHALTTDGGDADALHLRPSMVADIVAQTTPPAAHTVRFALLGAPLDAVLGLTETTTDATTGEGHVRLIAPSTPTSFQVQASAIGALPFPLDLAVPKTGMALLAVNPSYPGERVFNGVVASAWENKACSELPGSPPDEDGPLVASSPKFPVPLLVPTDTKLAVTLRAARFAWGCTTVNSAIEGAANDVDVVMTNVPMNLGASQVDFTLGLDTADDFVNALAAPRQALLAAVLGDATDDVDALLAAMEANAGSSAFHAARADLGWDDAVRAKLGASAATAVRDPLARWIDGALESDAALTGIKGSLAGATNGPSVTVSSVFGVEPARSGFTPSDASSWEAGADDGILIGMSMSVSPAEFLLGAARGPALDEVTSANSVSAALGAVVSCADVAATLVAHGVSKNVSFKGCDAGCTEQICINAMHTLVDTATTSDDGPSTLDIALTASGSVGDNAELHAFSGNWLGHWLLDEGTMNLNGPATGLAPKLATP